MSTLRKLGAWIGFAYDVGRIIFRREYDEPRDEHSNDDDQCSEPTTPVVRISPDASLMISRPTTTPTPSGNEPLEGSIEARRRANELR